MKTICLSGIFLFLCISENIYAQDIVDTRGDSSRLPMKTVKKYSDVIESKDEQLSNKLDSVSEKSLANFQREELKLQRRLEKIDSAKAASIFGNSKQKYASLRSRVQNIKKSEKYIPGLDSANSALNFLGSATGMLGVDSSMINQLKSASKAVENLKTSFQKSDDTKAFLKERQEYLNNALQNSPIASKLKGINKEAYYYSQQVKQVKDAIKHPENIEQTALGILSKSAKFQDFISKNGFLAKMFPSPSPTEGSLSPAVDGLQSRAQISQIVTDRTGIVPGGKMPAASQLQSAQSTLNDEKSEMEKKGQSGSDDIVAEHFKPNDEKTKPLLQRLELGMQLQSHKSSGFLPATTDIGWTLAYKFNPSLKSGIGVKYKLGLGQDIKHMSFTHQGISWNAFADFKLKGSLWVTGGPECSYMSAFKTFDQLKNKSAWQSSALAGLSKSIKMRKLKGSVQILYDFLWQEHFPVGQPVLLKTNYTF